MKNYIGSFYKLKLPSNHPKLKSILSILAIGVFIFFGFASIDQGDPTTRTPNDCEFLHPPVMVTQKCIFEAFDEKKNAPGKLSIDFHIREYDKVSDNNGCSLVLKNSYTRTLNFGSSGEASLILSKTYVSNDDVIEIYFIPSVAGYYDLEHTELVDILDGTEFHRVIHLLKIDQFP